MSDLLERTTTTTTPTRTRDVGPAPPTTAPPAAPTAPPPWPRTAKIVVAILAVATLLAALGTFAATRGDDGTADQQARIDTLVAEQEQLTADLETATARAEALTTQRDDLNARIADLDAEIAAADAEIAELTTQVSVATTDRAELSERLDEAYAAYDELEAQQTSLIAERDALQANLAAAEAEVAGLELRLDTATDLTATLDQRIAILDVQVGYLLDRAVSAEAERDALIDLFPIELDSSLQDVDVTGEWKLDWDEAYCKDFATCGATPGFTTLTITETPQNWLRVEVDGVFEAGLFRVDGALYAITESATAAPACDGQQRVAHVGLTLYAHGVTVAQDGTHQIDDLGATYVVEAPATATCPPGVAFYGASLTAS